MEDSLNSESHSDQRIVHEVNNSNNTLSLDEYLVHFLKENKHQTETELAK